MLDLEHKVVLIGLRSELDFLDFYMHLLFLGFLQFLALLILKLALIHYSADRRPCSGRNFNKIKLQL
jgi:hypothetical protein